ncbi:hypothetical protein RD792_016225 [Penstemon davidsonii]|uniref:Uncharacterized protein n=1 Tax=Penstemon davidsonii TaxID=160366 RepID=A0ABR0CLC6_9LAMI|nr:hypothetical protein RD792_016225 [Penstemon davidsonii]
MARFSPRLLNEIAIGLEESTQYFIWVVRKGKNGEEEEDWLPDGFEERMKGVSVGNKKWQRVASEGVSNEAVGRVMVGEEASEMRKRANYYKEMARKSIEEGGSSDSI